MSIVIDVTLSDLEDGDFEFVKEMSPYKYQLFVDDGYFYSDLLIITNVNSEYRYGSVLNLLRQLSYEQPLMPRPVFSNDNSYKVVIINNESYKIHNTNTTLESLSYLQGREGLIEFRCDYEIFVKYFDMIKQRIFEYDVQALSSFFIDIKDDL